MAYRRKYVKRRFKRKARTIRRSMRRAMPRPMYGQGKIYAFKRTCEIRSWYYDAGVWQQQADNTIANVSTSQNLTRGIYKFRLQDLPNYTDFTSLYENFRITGVRLRFMPCAGTDSTYPATTSTLISPLALCIDRGCNDNIASNPSFTSLLENQDCKIRTGQRPFSLYIAYPKAHSPADGLSQTVLTSPWLDSEVNGEGVDHHGLKFCFQQNVPSDRAVYFRVYATYYVKCRAPQ